MPSYPNISLISLVAGGVLGIILQILDVNLDISPRNQGLELRLVENFYQIAVDHFPESAREWDDRLLELLLQLVLNIRANILHFVGIGHLDIFASSFEINLLSAVISGSEGQTELKNQLKFKKINFIGDFRNHP